MIHYFLLFLGLTNPYFHIGDHICTHGFNEFKPNKPLDFEVENVGKDNYLLGEGEPDNPRSFTIESIGDVDLTYRICTQEDLVNISKY